METAIEVRSNGELSFTQEQSQMIRDTFANGASEAEFAVLLEVAKSRRLNPLLRQIHFVKRFDSIKKREVWSTQASIDGLRAVAQRTGLYDGQDEPEYEYDDNEKLKCAKVRIYRKDWRRPAVGVAHFSEYVQRKQDGTPNTFWATKPHIMLAKCAEALGLRKAFPEDMAGLYVPEEMGEAGAKPVPELPRISPHGEPEDGVVYEPDAVVDAVLQGIVTSQSLDELRLAWEPYSTPESLEKFHPSDRRDIGSAYRKRERSLMKNVTDNTGQDDL